MLGRRYMPWVFTFVIHAVKVRAQARQCPRDGGVMIGEEIRRRREEKGLTGFQLAAKAGMAPSAVSQIETGKRTPSSASVVKLAEALGVEVGDLYPKPQPRLPDPSEHFPEAPHM